MDFGAVLIVLGVIFLLAFLIQTLVERLAAPLFDNIGALGKWKWVQLYIAIGVAVAGAFLYHFDILYLVSVFLGSVVGAPPTIPITGYGITLTGIAIGQGAAYLHDVIDGYFKKPSVPTG